MGELTKYAYVRYSEAAVESTCSRPPAPDSGGDRRKQQVLGQVRCAYAVAESNRTVALHELAQRALSVGKRVPETAIDAAGASVAVGRPGEWPSANWGTTAVVIGAGAMGALSAVHLTCAGVGHI